MESEKELIVALLLFGQSCQAYQEKRNPLFKKRSTSAYLPNLLKRFKPIQIKDALKKKAREESLASKPAFMSALSGFYIDRHGSAEVSLFRKAARLEEGN